MLMKVGTEIYANDGWDGNPAFHHFQKKLRIEMQVHGEFQLPRQPESNPQDVDSERREKLKLIFEVFKTSVNGSLARKQLEDTE